MLLFPFLLGFDYPQSQLVSSRSTGMFNCTHNALACSSINGAEGLWMHFCIFQPHNHFISSSKSRQIPYVSRVHAKHCKTAACREHQIAKVSDYLRREALRCQLLPELIDIADVQSLLAACTSWHLSECVRQQMPTSMPFKELNKSHFYVWIWDAMFKIFFSAVSLYILYSSIWSTWVSSHLGKSTDLTTC